MITYPLVMPSTPGPREMSFELMNHVAETTSPFTGSSQTQEWPAEYIGLTMSLPPMPRTSAAAWIAFLAALRGKAGSFLAGPRGNEATPRGVLGGTPLVNGANAAQSKTLNTKGWTPSRSNVLRAGDWFQVGTNLFMNMTDVDSDASGLATLDVFPRLREVLADNTAVVTSSPKGVFRLKDNARRWEIDRIQRYGLSVSCREDF